MSKLDRDFIEKVNTVPDIVCRNALDRDAFILVNEYQNEIAELKENNARLTEQNKKLLEKEIENTRLRNENQTIREDNKYLDERSDKLVDELRNRDSKIRDLLTEIDRQNKELYHRREWEQMVRVQPTMILHTEPVKIEPINYTKLAKAADKATKSLNEAAKAINKLKQTCNGYSDAAVSTGVPTNILRAALGLPLINFKPQDIAREGDVFAASTPNGKDRYFSVMAVDPDGIYNHVGARFTSTVTKIFRLDKSGDLRLIWKR